MAISKGKMPEDFVPQRRINHRCLGQEKGCQGGRAKGCSRSLGAHTASGKCRWLLGGVGVVAGHDEVDLCGIRAHMGFCGFLIADRYIVAKAQLEFLRPKWQSEI